MVTDLTGYVTLMPTGLSSKRLALTSVLSQMFAYQSKHTSIVVYEYKHSYRLCNRIVCMNGANETYID